MTTPNYDVTGLTHYDSMAVPAEEIRYVRLAHHVNSHRAKQGRGPLTAHDVKERVGGGVDIGQILGMLPAFAGLFE